MTDFEFLEADFQSWLEGKPEDEVVGYALCSASCPLQQYLTARLGVEGITVGACTYTRWDHATYHDKVLWDAVLPDWAYHFRQCVDVQLPHSHPVTARAALGFLEQARHRMVELELVV